MKVRVLRAFYVRSEPQEAGSVVEVDLAFARELVAMGKVEFAEEAKPSGAMTTESASKLVRGKGKRNAEHPGN